MTQNSQCAGWMKYVAFFVSIACFHSRLNVRFGLPVRHAQVKSHRELYWKPTLYTLTFCMCCTVKATQPRALLKRLWLAVTPAQRKASLYGSTSRIPLFFFSLHIPQPLTYQLGCFYCRLDLDVDAGSYRSCYSKRREVSLSNIHLHSTGIYQAARHTRVFIRPRMNH